MTKRDLVIRICNETKLKPQVVQKVVQKTLDHICDAVIEGKTVELRNFGVFGVKRRKPRVGRNPNAPETDVKIPERSIVKFKPGKEMREGLRRLDEKNKEKTRKEMGKGVLRSTPEDLE
ncbi:MAG: Integration host factor subunit beta [Verrucomicrobia subdivision 3 bacterium]|nr:Integration host factor subunit beta [Limisphaerales bacterium]MCS1414163.1 Integration host factor subunit beta [Limisphaerales bacterium]